MFDQALTQSIFDPNSPILLSIPFVLFVFKMLFLILFALYIVYALIIVRQIELMARTVTTNLEFFVRLMGWLHLLAALGVWLLAFFA